MRVWRGALMAVVFSSLVMSAQAQGRQIKMYLEQIAANKVYIEYLQKGYSIVRQGLNVISDIKNGHLTIDRLFFDGLVAINPRIRQYPHVAEILVMAVQITAASERSRKLLNKEGILCGDLRAYADRVTGSLTADCVVLLSDLADLLTARHLQLSDDERIKRIDQIHAEMADRYTFIQNWSAETSVLILQMKKEQLETARMKSVNDLK